MDKLLKYWKTLGWGLFMLVLFLIPGDSLSKSPSFPGISELVHISLFAFFVVFLVNDVYGIRRIKKISLKILVITGLIGLLFGIVIEGLQEWMGLGRTAELKDIFYDLLGILLGFLLIVILRSTGSRS